MLFGLLVRRLIAVCLLKLAEPYKLLSSRGVAAELDVPSAFYSLGISGSEQTERVLASNPLRRVLWKVHYPRAHLFQSQRREKKTPPERKQMSAHSWDKFFILCRRKRSGEAVLLTLSLMLSFHINCTSLRQKCFYCALLPAGPTIFNQATDKTKDQIALLPLYFPLSLALHSGACHLHQIHFVVFDISDCAQRYGNVFILCVAESENAKNQNLHRGISFSQSPKRSKDFFFKARA